MELLAVFYLIPGAAFLAYGLHCLVSNYFARGHLRDEPLALLFLEGVGLPVAGTAAVIFAALFYDKVPVWVLEVFLYGGYAGFIALTLAFLIRLPKCLKELPKRPWPRLQFALHDLIGMAFGMGTYLFLEHCLLRRSGYTTASWAAGFFGNPVKSPVLFFAVSIALAPLAFLLALDVCRLSALPLGSSSRACTVGCTFFVGMLCLPIAAFAWARWRWQTLKYRPWAFDRDPAPSNGLRTFSPATRR